MIRTLDGDQILQDEFGTLLAINVTTMLYRIEKLPRGNKNVELRLPRHHPKPGNVCPAMDAVVFYSEALSNDARNPSPSFLTTL